MSDIQSLQNSIPLEVDEIVEYYFSLLRGDLKAQIDGFYLVGSLALKDYISGVSDIDFVAVLKKPMDETSLQAFREIHKKVIDFKSTYLQGRVPNLDGLYLQKSDLLAPPKESLNAPFSFDGSLHVDETSFEANPVTWEILREKAIPVHGKALAKNEIYSNHHELLRFSYENLISYWQPWVEGARKDLENKKGQEVSAETMTWGVLGVSRIAYLLEQGQVSSKTLAGHWAARQFPAWTEIIMKSCEWRRDPGKKKISFLEAMEALEYVEACIAKLRNEHQSPGELMQ